MPCYHPISAYRPRAGGPILFVERGDCDPLQIACGQCRGCRLERSRQWAVRCMHEAQMHECNCFVTFTYDDEHVPAGGVLVYRHFQDFIRKLRKVFKKKGNISYYVAGEYGEEPKKPLWWRLVDGIPVGRPHFHALLFGIDFNDKFYWRQSPAGFKLFRSSALEQVWTFGGCEIGSVSFESAAYCARYVMKKMNGDRAETHYRVVDVDGEVYARPPEFNRMSLKPAIGLRWLEKYHSDVYPDGKVVVRGVRRNAPRYYDKKYISVDEERAAELAVLRYNEAKPFAADNTIERLAAKEIVAEAREKMLKRTID